MGDVLLDEGYYDPSTGRFISEDSYWGEDENPLSLNLYTYCENDPIRYTDPSGNVPMFAAGIIQDVPSSQVEEYKRYGMQVVEPGAKFWGGIDNYANLDTFNTFDGSNTGVT
ncbi:MAG: RHS repeat-associated core domain-containing protein, partial [Ruminiclostridium sp.]